MPGRQGRNGYNYGQDHLRALGRFDVSLLPSLRMEKHPPIPLRYILSLPRVANGVHANQASAKRVVHCLFGALNLPCNGDHLTTCLPSADAVFLHWCHVSAAPCSTLVAWVGRCWEKAGLGRLWQGRRGKHGPYDDARRTRLSGIIQRTLFNNSVVETCTVSVMHALHGLQRLVAPNVHQHPEFLWLKCVPSGWRLLLRRVTSTCSSACGTPLGDFLRALSRKPNCEAWCMPKPVHDVRIIAEAGACRCPYRIHSWATQVLPMGA